MVKFICCLSLLFWKLLSFGQPIFKADEAYTIHASRAYQLYEGKQYRQSALSYDSLLKKYKGSMTKDDKYDAACSWALAGNKDKAFSYLRDVVANDSWSSLSRILADSDLVSLHADPHWQPLIATVTLNKAAADARLDQPLMTMLDSIYKVDQGDRMAIAPVQKKYGYNGSPQWNALFHKIQYDDSANLVQVKKIIDASGWLGPDKVGENGALAIFLIIQHADSLTQVDYAPLMREAVQAGRAPAQNLALLEDRILTRQGKPQLYGSQLRTNEKTGKNEFFPIVDESNVNKRRALMGLEPLETYAKSVGMEYKIPVVAEHK